MNLKYRFKEMYENYGLPSVVTVIFLIILLILLLMRLQQSSILSEVFKNNGSNLDYASLLSSDEIDALQENMVASDEKNVAKVENKEKNPAAATTSETPFTINSGVSSVPTSSNGGSGTSAPPTTTDPNQQFSASVASIRSEGSSAPQCDTASPGSGFSSFTPNCTRTYYFGGTIKTSGGPGTVSYEWDSSHDGGKATGSFEAGSGDTLTSLKKQVTLPCNEPNTLTMKLLVTSPNSDASADVIVTHSC